MMKCKAKQIAIYFFHSLCYCMKFIRQIKGQCNVLVLVGHQVPTKAALSLPSLAGQEGENTVKGLGVKTKNRDGSLTNHHHKQIESEKDNEK